MSAAINLIIKIIKRDINTALAIVNKGIISILTPLIMDIEVSPADTERIELIRNTSKVFAELTEIQNLDILVILLLKHLYRKEWQMKLV